MRLRTLLLAAALSAALGLGTAAAQVKVWEGVLTLPTYEEALPDPNPPFEQFSTNFINYPYTLRNNLTSRRSDHDWRAVYLENEYLLCSVLPDLGGHLYSCLDKISGQPMFYANPSIKRNSVSFRGSWAAFGIEFNFPVSHNWVTMSPVWYRYTTESDGSASATVGNVDRVYGMEWSVELILRPGSTVLEEKVTLNNRSDTRHRFYWWNNAGVEVKDDSRIVYPMRFSASHGFRDVDTWPVDASGADLSMVGNHRNGPVSLFAHGSREPFMGVWRPDTRTGTVHYADYAALPAKKIWSWGADADGLDWRKALSDNNSAYVEVQAGLFRNQETYAFLEPRQTIRFSEYWMPVHDMGGFTRANLAGVLNFSRKDQTLTAEINANRAYPGAVVRFLDQGRVMAQQKADLKPEQTWRTEITSRSSGPVTIEVQDHHGVPLLVHTEGEYDWTPASEIRTGPQPVYVSPAPAQRTESDWLEQGKREELSGKLVVAMTTYERGLLKFPHSFWLMKSAGRLAASLSRYDEAVRYLEPAAAQDTGDPEPAYYLGLAYEGLGQRREARTAYENAARMPEFRVAGGLRLAELLAREGQPQEALELLRELDGDLRVVEETVALENALGRKDQAQALARKTLKSALSQFLTFETANRPEQDVQLIGSLAADPDRVLNIAAEYMRLGLYSRALDVLSLTYPSVPPDQAEPGAVLPQDHPLVAYYRGYCREKLGESAQGDDRSADSLSTRYIFPGGAATSEVLLAALRRNPQSAMVHYLLGTQYFSVGRTDAALSEWNAASKLNPRLPVLHASMGRALLQLRKDPAGALQAFTEGLAADPGNVALYSGMDQALSLMGRPARERVAALERYPDLAQMPAELVYELALNRAEAGHHDQAFALLKGRFIPRQEFGTNVRQVWVELKLVQALSLAAGGQCDRALSVAETLEVAVPGFDFTRDGLHSFVMAARTQFLLGTLEAQCSGHEQAAAHFRSAAASKVPAETVWARRAARQLPGYDEAQWNRNLEAALANVEEKLETLSQRGFWAYASGLLNQELGRTDAARARLTQAALLPDRMLSLHLSRLAIQDLPPAGSKPNSSALADHGDHPGYKTGASDGSKYPGGKKSNGRD